MLDAIPRERLQPSLLDRLTDEVKGIETELGRLRQVLLPVLDEDRRETLAALLAPERPGGPSPTELERFADLGPDTVNLVRRLVGLEQRRQHELQTRFVLSPERLRACVLRDLHSLLNTESLRWREGRALDPAIAARPDIEAFPQAMLSVINYGIPPLAGRTTLEPEAVARDLQEAIREFEPRLRAVQVRPAADGQAGHALAFDIEAELMCEPAPMRLLLRTLIDLESGAATISAAGGG